MGYGHTLFASDRESRLDSMALSADGERVVFGGYACASNDGSCFGSVMRARLYAQVLLRDEFECAAAAEALRQSTDTGLCAFEPPGLGNLVRKF
jgi:hypothetical protein